MTLLDPDVVWRTDGGGKVNAALVIHHGAGKVARAMMALARHIRGGYGADVNGAPGLVLGDRFGFLSVISLTVDAGRIVAIDIVRNPDKLATVPAP
jgi:RNA polymerase sigma-70 factor (ECF subfamily)